MIQCFGFVDRRGVLRSKKDTCSEMSFLPRYLVSASSEVRFRPQSKKFPQKRLQELRDEVERIVRTAYPDVESARKDAESLLELTFPAKSISNLLFCNQKKGKNKKFLNDEKKNIRFVLHMAFIHLVSKIALHSSSLAVLLTQRVHTFGLCLHLPLYKQIIEGAAKDQSKKNYDPVSSILEIAFLAAHSLPLGLEARFFEEALQNLIWQENYMRAIQLLNAMRERHDISKIPILMSVSLLEIIQHNLKESSYFVTKEKEILMITQASDLVMTLCESLGETTTKMIDIFDSRDGLKESLNQLLKEFQDNSEVYDATDAEIDDDLETIFSVFQNRNDVAEDDLSKAQALIDAIIQQQEHYDDDIDNFVFTTPFDKEIDIMDLDDNHLSSSIVENSHHHWNYDNHDELCRDVLYLRNNAKWEIPDVTEQLSCLHYSSSNPQRKGAFLYSRELEKRLLNELIDSEGF